VWAVSFVASNGGKTHHTVKRHGRAPCGEVPDLAVGLSRISAGVLGPKSCVGIFWSKRVSFRSEPKIVTLIGPLLELVFRLFLGPVTFFRYSNSV
jgi:hypothetical protein